MNNLLNQKLYPCLSTEDPGSVTTFFDGLRRIFLTVRVDTSGSMSHHKPAVTAAVKALLKALADQNYAAEDAEFVVRIVTFNNSVHLINDTFLPPDQLMELVDDSTFDCRGGTNLTAIVQEIDQDCSRSGISFAGKHTSDFQPMSLLITDFMGTDDASSRQAAVDRLLDNRLYTEKTQSLCVFVGPEHLRDKVAALAGGADRVIALSDDLDKYLTPVVMGSTINMAMQTHINAPSSGDIGRNVAARSEDGSLSADELADELKHLLASNP